MALGLEAPGGLGGLCGSRSSLGGTGGREDCGAMDMGDGGRSTWITQVNSKTTVTSDQLHLNTIRFWQMETFHDKKNLLS